MVGPDGQQILYNIDAEGQGIGILEVTGTLADV